MNGSEDSIDKSKVTHRDYSDININIGGSEVSKEELEVSPSENPDIM